jgi:hypothetical protein
LLAILAASGASATPNVAHATPTAYPIDVVVLQGGGSASQHELGRADALETFRLDYAKTHDTAIRDLGVEVVGDGYARAWLSDDDGGSPLVMVARWRNMSAVAYERRHWVVNCRAKKCLIGSVRRDALDKVPLLAGFAIHNLAGAKNVERVAIYPEITKGPNAKTTYYAYFDADGETRYTVDLQLVFVDPAAVQGQHDASASSKAGTGYAAVPVHWKTYGLLALQGFDVRFTNGKHALNRLAIDTVKGNNSVRAVHFADHNSDDPMTARLWWADLRPL